ncbi:non-ribosomal peptide synthase/polyketide synthase [Brevibacillus gelatini]|nr:non-ribosomal peptide synthase/polyketide synthase [Brevibacillus gelatini]
MSRNKIDNIYPLSPMQEGMLFHSLLDEETESYFEQFRFTIKGLIDPAILEQSLNALIERHDILRTVFLLEKVQKPRQVVLKERKTTVQVVDITHLNPDEQDAFLEDFASKDRRKGFDLAKDVLIRLALVRTSSDSYTLFWSHHHILLDGWCIPIVLNDFFQIYQQLNAGQPVQLGPVYPYSAYISWLGEQDAEEAKANWARYISGYEPSSFLQKQGVGHKYRQAEFVFAIDEALTGELNRLAKQLQVTVNNLFRTIWGLMLQRHCNTDDIIFGSVVSGRSSEVMHVEQMVGLFINTVPVRVQASERQTFADLVKQVQDESLSLEKYHYLSLADIQGKQNLIDHIVLFQNYPMGQEFLARLNQYNQDFTLTHLTAFEQTNYDLNVMVTPNDVITIKYIYNASCLTEEQLMHISQQLTTIMTQVTDNPDIPLQQLEVVDPAEKHRQLHSFNDTNRHYPVNQLIHQIFEERAEQNPDRVALVIGEQTVSYRELNDKANQLAAVLRVRGVGPESIVSLLVERSAEMLISILAILKAGGAYLPIDPAHPKERIEYILQDSKSQWLLTTKRFLETIDFPERIINLEAEEFYQGVADNPPCRAHVGNLAYVIYTSGSTGKPKGVMIEHASLLNILFALHEEYPLLENDAYLLKTTYTFDVSVAEIFGWMLGSGRLVILDPGAEKEPAQIWEAIVRHGVTHVNFVPSMLIPFVDYVQDREQANQLRYIFAAGEAMPSDLVAKVYEALPDVMLENIYGPTESTIYATKFSLTRDFREVSVPIGKPLANIQTHIVNRHGQLQPIGVPGELCIAGASLARGYLNNEELTNEKFVPHPFAEGKRMYRTGDLARYRPDGNIEYLGRIDHQVKIRGYRIELDEIRSQLILEDSIRDAVVVAHTDHNGQAYLCAYFIADKMWNVSSLREWLRQTLPEYMVPSHFIQMEEFPLTSSGKIDRKALPLPDGSVNTGTAYSAPRNPIEELLARIWEEVLAVTRVGIHDNFFELGGHSLLATQVLSRTAKLFQVQLTMREIFTYQTVAELAERIQFLRQGAEVVKLSAIEPRPLTVSDEWPLSYAQQRLWFLDRLIPNSAMYNIPVGFRLRGEVDAQVLECALNEIIRRHESLRTTFIDVDGRAVQVIHTDVHLSLGVMDLRNKPAAEKDAEWKRMAAEDASTPFQLDQWPLMRAVLIRLAEQESILWLNVHHIIADGWSMDVLVNELSTVYEALLKKEAVPLADLPIQYRDYAIWQREQGQNDVWEKQLGYWKQKLAGSEPLLPLPTDRPRPVVQSYRGDNLSFFVSGEVGQKLRELGRKEGATLFMTLLAAFKSFLYRYTHTTDILIGTPVAGRNRQEIENLIGFFVNMLVLRTDLSGDPSFVELLRRVRETAFDAFANEDLPFEKLVDELQIERSLSYSPLFQVLFALQGMSTGVREGETLAIAPDEVQLNQTTKFDLTLTMIEAEDGGFKGVFEYSTDLFDRSTIERMAGHFCHLLQAVAAQPGQKLTSIPLLGDAERTRMLVEWNRTEAAYSCERNVHELVACMAREFPEQLAVIGEEGAITYAELDAKANQLAHVLLKRKIGAEDLVGICVERSIEMLIGQLAILKAGAAYVPMDPAYPRERLAFMMDDAQMSLVLTQERLLGALPESAAAYLCLDRDWQEIAQESRVAPAITTKAEQLAYVIYTSGSTGTPKGVQIEHGSLLNLVYWHQRAYNVTAGDRASQIAGTAFDASVWETWPYLTAGATICQPPEEIRLMPEKLRDWLVESAITISFLPTPLAESLLALEWPNKTALRYMLTGGDKLHQYPTADVPFTLVNQYGPTENTVVATAGVVPAGGERASAPSIGRPIDNVAVYVLDENRQPVPTGVVGELYIAGKSLARGYLNRPDLTAASFVPNPFSPVPGERMYRTGDLVRYGADGSLEFIGRADNQVSIRGFRIELGEIETALYTHPAVLEAVVVVREDVTPGMKRLVAYVVLHEGEAILTGELRQSLKEKLPDYMVPYAIVLLDALPLTPNGKVDRRALPRPDVSQTEWEGRHVPPQTEAERKLAEIWQEVLGVESIGVHDNFFELGGDSILTIQIVSRASQAGLKLTPKHLFDAQTLAELAASAVVVEDAPQQAEQGVVTGELPLTPIQMWFFEQEIRDLHHWNQSVMLAVREKLDATFLAKAFAALPVHHDALRLRFPYVDGKRKPYHAAIADEDVLQVIDLSSVPEADREARMQAIADELQGSVDIEKGPLHRAAYFQLGSEQRLFIVIHHLAVDGVSWRIILEDLQTAYQQLKAGQKLELPRKTTSFKSWSEALVQFARQSKVDDYWMQLDTGKICPLPVDHPTGTNKEGLAVQVKAKLSVDETRALLQEVPAAYRTQINDVLLSALTRTVADWTGQETLYVAVEGHGREAISDGVDISRTVGWFTSMYPVLLEAKPEMAWGDMLKSIKEQLRAIPDKGIGYGIHRYLSNDGQTVARLTALPQPEISFNYLGQFGQAQTADAALFQMIPNWSASNQGKEETRLHKLDFLGMVTQDQLEMTWTYSGDLYEQSTVEKLARRYVQALQAIIAHCRTEEAGGYTPSDFPLAELDQKSLDKFIGKNRRIENVYTLTPLQEGMLFHSLYEQTGGDYVVQLALKLNDVNVALFAEAWQKVVERHAILRTSILWSGLEKPHQVVHTHVKADVTQLDWRHLTEAEQEASLQAYLEQDRKRGFDLARPPLMRWALIRLNANTSQFVWSFHHMLLDGWSTPIVFNDWLAFYQAARQGREAKLPAIPPFSAYIAWLKRQNLQAAEQYWRDYLRGFSVPTPLAMGKAGGSAGQPKEYADHKLVLTKETTARLHAFARRHQLTLNTLVQGAWALILGRYAGEAEVLFGATSLGRPADLTGAESMVGLFINTLPVRVLLPEQTDVISWLHDLQQAQSEMRQYEFTPLVDIQSWSEVPRGQSLFDSIFVFENYLSGTSAESDSGVWLGEVKAVEQTSYPLTLVVAPGEELLLKLIYETGRFEREAIDRVLAQLSRALEVIMLQPQEPLAALSIITDEERHKLLVEWNATEAEYARDVVIHQLVEAQAAATPDAVALVVGEERLTYRELNERANQLARYLREQGIGPEVLVAVLMERTTEMIVAMLGILKAGGAYVPIDPAYPQNRIGYTLDDSQAAVVLTQERLLPMLPDHAARVICLDRDWERIAAAQRVDNLPSLAKPTNLSYVIYTSGSTGLPKGVAIQHSSVIAFIHWAKTVFSAEEMSGVLASTSICFDLSVYEIFVTLSCGGKVILADNALHLPNLPAANEVTLVNTVPSAAKELVRMNAIPSSVRVVNLAGEPLPNTLAQSLYALEHVEKVFNLYGPSEDTTYSTYVQVPKGAETEPTIGRPLSNTQAYILDASLQPVPLGLPGELYLGGDGLARGYLNRPELTAERFVPNPFHPDPHARMYRTGDLVRYLPDGQIEYLGRLDHQVKIRGYRIELGELEAVLRTHPAVKEAVVMAREDKLGEKRLVAYLTEADGKREESAVLTAWAKAKLPEFMVPSVFVWLEAMPLTPNGKIDRKQLPEPEWSQTVSTQDYAAPRNETEEMVANIWSDVLGVGQVGIHDNFFELGGHSLLATRVISRLRETFAKDVPIRAIFENQTVAKLCETLGEMLPEKTEAAISPVSRDRHLPLSFAQQRLWFLDRLMPDSTLYSIPSAVRLLGDLHIEAWEKSMQTLIRRHESLRTTFGDVDGKAVQVIHPELAWTLNVIDLRGLPADEREAEAHRLAGVEAATPFCLSKGPLWRTLLIRLTEQESVFLFNMHHIIFDGWSIRIFIQEMRALYEAFVYGAEPHLDELPLQYADYAVWQREWLKGDVLTGQLAYWKDKLAGAEPLLALPTDRPRPAVQSHEGAMYTIALSDELQSKLNTFSREEGVSLFMTLLAAFQTLLYRYSGQEDILVGSPVAGRTRQETEQMIGFFVNTLVLRTDLSGEPSFRDLLARVRETALEAFSHQDLPFEKLIDELELERSLSYSPLFQVMFVLQNFQLDVSEKAGIRLAEFDMDEHLVTAKYDLTLTMAEKASGLTATFEYSTALFDQATIVRMAKHFTQLLEAVVQMPEQSITRLPLLAQDEREQLLVAWNDTATAYPRTKRVDQLFQEAARTYPERIAVVSENRAITYAELEKRANQTANYLQKQGVRSGSLVGICVKRSLDMLIGLLGILKAGGAYVPLDPDYPQERLAYMMNDAQLTVLLTQEQLLSALPAGERTTICLDRDWATIAKESELAPALDTTAESLAYVIYTSGSTGLPKGTLVPHRGIVRLVKETDYVTITEQDVFLQASTVSFDAATFEIWGSLLNGAKLVLLPPELPSLADIAQAIRTHKVTTLWLTAGLFTLLVDHHKEYLAGVRQLLVGGDVVSVAHVRKALEIAGLTVINGYGPTENTTFTCCYPVTELPETFQSFPIGRPIKNTTVYVLDRHMQPVPIGVTGELYIGGDGLAIGYLNRPDLTAERFVPNPFSSDPKERLYRTGDLVRYLPNGLIEFIGRIDNQVKIRGFRIELSEVESVLAKHPAVAASVVVVRESEPGMKQLVAYVVKEAEQGLEPAELRQHFKAHVPDYMVPAAFVMLDALPLTPNGKVDRKALPEPVFERSQEDSSFTAATSLIEQKLVDIWCAVLRMDRIGIHDNFFELGGDSILSIQIVARANKAGIHLTPKQLFDYQTIAELAKVAEKNQKITVEQGKVTGDVPLLPIQSWFFEQEQPSPHHWNQSMLLRVNEPLEEEPLQQAVAHLLAHHDALRLRYTYAEGQWKQAYADVDADVPLSVEDLSMLPPAQHAKKIEKLAQQAQASLDLANGPLVKVVYFDLGFDRPGRLLIVIHHLVVDGVSWRVLIEDLQTAYMQAANGKEIQLPAKTTSYKTWAEKLREYAASDRMLADRTYWLAAADEMAAHAPAVDDRERNIEENCQTLTISLEEAETDALLQKVPARYRVQINDILLTALALAYAKWTGEHSLLVNLEGHGREELFEDVDLSRTVGWFTSMYPLLIQLDQTMSLEDTLARVKEKLQQIPNKGLGYGLLRYIASDDEVVEKLKAIPQAPISFNYLGQFHQAAETDSLFGFAEGENRGSNNAPDNKRAHLIDVVAAVTEGKLGVSFLYDETRYSEASIETFARHYTDALRSLIHAEKQNYRPEDFEDADLSQTALNKVLAKLKKR